MSKSIVCIGIVCLDIVNTLPGSLAVGGKHIGADLMLSPGGIVKNSAEVLARMGHRVSLISAAGQDAFSTAAVQGCESAGIDISHIRRFDEGSIVTCIQVVDGNGELFVMTGTKVHPNSEVTLQQIKDADSLINGAGMLMLCPSLSDEVLNYIVTAYPHIAKLADVGAASNAEKMAPYLKYLHTLKVNLREAEAFCNFSIPDENLLRKAADLLLEKGVQNVAITLGDKGAVYANKQGFHYCPAVEVQQVKNTAGAGDSFAAGLMHGYINGLDIDTTLNIASACSRLTIQSSHTVNPDITLQAVYREAGYLQSLENTL